MDLAAYVADFKLLSKTQSSYIVKDSKLLHRHGEFMSIYDYFILDDTSFNQKYVIYESSFKNLKLFVVSSQGCIENPVKHLR